MFPLKRFVVKGHSMQPSLTEGDHILVNKWAYLLSKPKKGDIIVFKTINEGKFILKRIYKIVSQGLLVKGDNKVDSLDSSHLGIIKPGQIQGRFLSKY